MAAPVLPPGVDEEAYRAYLLGRHHLNMRSPASIQLAIRKLTESVRRAPDFALAHATLADAYNVGGAWGVLAPSAVPAGLSEADRALQLDDSLPEAHASVAFGKFMWKQDFDGARRGFQRALELNPAYIPAYHWYARMLAAVGHNAESLSLALRAREMDPLSPVINYVVAGSYYLGGNHDSALKQCNIALDLDPRLMAAVTLRGRIYMEQGRYPEAIAELHRAVTVSANNSFQMALLGRAYARNGQHDQARALLAQIEDLSVHQHVPPSSKAILLAALGESEEAIRKLEEGVKQHDPNTVWLKVDPAYASLRGHPAFEALTRGHRLIED